MIRLDFHNVAPLDRELLLQEIGETDFADEAQSLGVFLSAVGNLMSAAI